MTTILETIGEHPWAAAGVGTWLLFALAIVVTGLQECVAIVVTRTRGPRPDAYSNGTRASTSHASSKGSAA
jgi:hypothetical protein